MASLDLGAWGQEELFGHLLSFAERDDITGGPDTHMSMAAHRASDDDQAAALWTLGTYVSVYTVAGGYQIEKAWPLQAVSYGTQEALEDWLRGHWQGIPIRRERRAVRTPKKLSRMLTDYAEWIKLSASDLLHIDVTPKQRYVMIWESLTAQVWGLGRYSLLKLCESMIRADIVKMEMPDIRPIGGDSPRTMLHALFPDAPITGNGTDSIRRVNYWVQALRNRARKDFGFEFSMYTAEVYLCEFLQCMKRNQYPGRALDSEMTHAMAAEAYWGPWPAFWEMRKELFPHWALGELNGWQGRRKELGDCLLVSRYMWSDARYDYKAMTDVSEPVAKEVPVGQD